MVVKRFAFVIVSLLTMSMLWGCSQEQVDPVRQSIGSGTENEAYTGEKEYILEKNVKISEEEKKNGIKKYEIEHDVEIDELEENDAQQNKEEESGDDGSTKPHV